MRSLKEDVYSYIRAKLVLYGISSLIFVVAMFALVLTCNLLRHLEKVGGEIAENSKNSFEKAWDEQRRLNKEAAEKFEKNFNQMRTSFIDDYNARREESRKAWDELGTKIAESFEKNRQNSVVSQAIEERRKKEHEESVRWRKERDEVWDKILNPTKKPSSGEKNAN